MGDYVADYSEIEPIIGRAISATARPTQAQVNTWISRTESMLLGTLRTMGIATSYSSGTDGFKIIQGWVQDAVGGMVRRSHAAVGGDGSNEDGQKEIDAFKALIMDIRAQPDVYGGMLDSGGTPTADSVMCGSHVDDADLDLSASDYAPQIEIEKVRY